MKTQIRLTGQKTTPNAINIGLQDPLEKAEQAQTELAQALAKDTTKTPEMRDLFLAKAGQKEINSLLSAVERKALNFEMEADGLQQKVDKQLSRTSTTDFLIMSAHAQMMTDASPDDVLRMFKETGDPDILRASLIIPQLRSKPAFVGTRDRLTEKLSRHVLGDKGHDDLQVLRAKKTSADALEVRLLAISGQHGDLIKSIENTIVT